MTTWRPRGSGGCRPEGRGAGRRLGNSEAMGATRSGRETQGSPQAHARARTGTYTTTPYTHVRRTRQGPETRSQGGAAGRAWAGLGGLGSLSRRAPAKACATGGGSNPPRPAQAGCSGSRAGERGVSPSPAALGAEGLGGARPWGRGPGAY